MEQTTRAKGSKVQTKANEHNPDISSLVQFRSGTKSADLISLSA